MQGTIIYHASQGGYTKWDFPGEDCQGHKILDHVAKRFLNWKYGEKGRDKQYVSVTVNTLRKNTKAQAKASCPPKIRRKITGGEPLSDDDLRGFRRYPSSAKDMEIRSAGEDKLLALRVRVPSELLGTLKTSHEIVPPKSAARGPRGEYEYRHYAMWADYAKRPYMSKEFINDGTAAEKWCAMNAPLFKFLSDQVRLQDPEAYRLMNDTPWLDNLIDRGAYHFGQKGEKHRNDVPLQKVAGFWHGLVINQNQRQAGEPHRDMEDASHGYNCVIPYGDWVGGDLVLWELNRRVELREGEALIFRGSLITHSVWRIEPGGTRHGVDLFTHQNLLDVDQSKRRRGQPTKDPTSAKNAQDSGTRQENSSQATTTKRRRLGL